MARKTYLGAKTASGTIIDLEPHLYNPTATVEAKDGSRSIHKLPKLIALRITREEPANERENHHRPHQP